MSEKIKLNLLGVMTVVAVAAIVVVNSATEGKYKEMYETKVEQVQKLYDENMDLKVKIVDLEEDLSKFKPN